MFRDYKPILIFTAVWILATVALVALAGAGPNGWAMQGQVLTVSTDSLAVKVFTATDGDGVTIEAVCRDVGGGACQVLRPGLVADLEGHLEAGPTFVLDRLTRSP